jgi:hypothetical protein
LAKGAASTIAKIMDIRTMTMADRRAVIEPVRARIEYYAALFNEVHLREVHSELVREALLDEHYRTYHNVLFELSTMDWFAIRMRYWTWRLQEIQNELGDYVGPIALL